MRLVFPPKALAYGFVLLALAFVVLLQDMRSTRLNSGGVFATKFGRRPSTAAIPLRGDLNVRPMGLHRCVTVRVRGVKEPMTADEAKDYLQSFHWNSSLRFGLAFVEEPDRFVALHKGFFHLYHFLEFLVIAYEELHRLASSSSERPEAPSTTSMSLKNNSTLARGSPSITVPWVYVPLFTQQEICGAAGGINCLIADLVLQASSAMMVNSSGPDRWITQIHGLESNDNATLAHHPALAGNYSKRLKQSNKTYTPDRVVVQNARHAEMAQTADAVLLIHRVSCGNEQHVWINKMWTNHIDNFPAQLWYQDVSQGLKQRPVYPVSDKQLTVGYIDRQNTNRRLPDAYHEGLVDYLEGHVKIDFLHLHMENYTSLEQIQIATTCDVLIGMHGNGLSHMLWMKPKRFVVELFWDFGFQFDYATAANLMGHRYMALSNGRLIDPERIQKLDPTLKGTRMEVDISNRTAFQQILEGNKALEEFLLEAMNEVI